MEAPNRKKRKLTFEDYGSDKCAICLGTLYESASSVVDSCPHIFCTACIKEWSNTSNTCPLCNSEFCAISEFSNRRNMIVVPESRDNRTLFDEDPFYCEESEGEELTDIESEDLDYDSDQSSEGSPGFGEFTEYYGLEYQGDNLDDIPDIIDCDIEATFENAMKFTGTPDSPIEIIEVPLESKKKRRVVIDLTEK